MRRLTLLTLLAAAGCDGGPELVPVDGRVTPDGNPVREMLINSRPVGNNPGTGAHAMTGADGRFTRVEFRPRTGGR